MRDDRQRVEDLVRSLVRIETENPPGHERPCAEYIVEWFDRRGVDAELVAEPEPERPQVAAVVGDGDPRLVLNAHVDVVPAGDPDEWTYDPYEGRVVDGTLYGRGSADTKCGVALAMLATADLADDIERGDLGGSIVFQAAMGEETGDPGTKTLLESGYTGDYGVVLEPTEMRVGTATKGTAWYTISVFGDAAHASSPASGDNAIENARPVVDALVEYGAEVRERSDELVGQAQATITEFSAGTKENVVPDRVDLTLDRRVLPDECFADVDAEVDALLDRVETEAGVRTRWERYQTYRPSSVPHDSEIAETFRRHANEVAGVPTDPWGVPAATDTRNLVNDAGIEAITWSPADRSQPHTVDEHLDLSDATTGLTVLERAVREVLE